MANAPMHPRSFATGLVLGFVTLAAMLYAVLVAGCNKSNATREDAGATTAPAASTAAAAATAASPAVQRARKPPSPREVVDAWNAAHVKHDAKALASIYAPQVDFYGKALTGAQCVAAKKAAFAKSPDYTQSVRDVVVGEDGVVTFTKTSTIAGVSKDYPAVLVVEDGLVAAETDKVTQANLAAQAAKRAKWCETDGGPNDTIVSPYRISAHEAQERARLSKYFTDTFQGPNPWYADLDEVVCPTKCDRAAFACGYGLGVVAHGHLTADPLSTPTWNVIDWVYVDAMDGTLWYDQGPDGKWQSSEPLPPLADK